MSSDVTKADIIKALPKLGADDLSAIAAICQTLAKGRTGAFDQGAGQVGQPIFDALVTALGRATPYNRLTARLRQQFDAKSAELTTVLDRDFPGWNKNRVLQTAFLRMLFDMLRGSLLAQKLNPTVTTMIAHMHRVPVVFDKEFPGYRDNKLGGLILKRLQKR